MNRKLLIWGKGGHGSVVEEAAMLTGQYTHIEHIDDNDKLNARHSWKEIYKVDEWAIHVAIGDNRCREAVSIRVRDQGYSIVTVIHPRAFVSPKTIVGDGCYIGPLTSVQTKCILGDGVIINTNASVDHDCFIGNYVHIAPGTNLCGSVHVGDRTLMAVGSRVVPDIKIGQDCIIGAGSAIVNQLDGNGLKIWGVPARVVE